MADDFVRRIIGSAVWSGVYAGKKDVRERLLKPLHVQFAAPSSIIAARILADSMVIHVALLQCAVPVLHRLILRILLQARYDRLTRKEKM